MNFDTAVMIKCDVILCWAQEPFTSPEMARDFIKENIQEIDARFLLMKGLNSLLRLRWFTPIVRCALATQNELYCEYTHLPLSLHFYVS